MQFWRGKPIYWAFVLAGLILTSLLGVGDRVWAAPGQDPRRQTVPTPTEVPKTATRIPPPPRPTLPPSTITVTPSASPTFPPLPTATSAPTAPGPAASPSVQIIILPAPTREKPTPARKCRPLEKTISPAKGGKLDRLATCRVLIQVPAEAVIEDTLLHLTPRLLTDAPPSEPWLQMRSVAFTLEAFSVGGHPRPGFIFARPYTATIRYNQTDVEVGSRRADSLTIAYYDAAAHKWTPLDSWVDPEERLVSAAFDRPGWLALMFALSETEGTPTWQPASAPTSPDVQHATRITTKAPTSASSPSSRAEAGNSTCFLGMAGTSLLLLLAAGLYVAGGRRDRD